MEQNNNTGFLGALNTLGQPQDVHGLWFNNKNLMLDGYRFIGCRFDSCALHINTTNFELINCYIDDRTVISYGANTLKVVKLYNSRNPYAYQSYPVFAPERNSDNTITIKGQ
jgi:hypothetical protein